MLDLNDLSIDTIGLSVRSRNALSRNGVRTVSDLLQQTEESLYAMSNLGKKSVAEILEKIRCYQDSDYLQQLEAEAKTAIKEYSAEKQECPQITREFQIQYLRDNNLKLDCLELLSSQAYNILRMNGITELWQILSYSRQELQDLPHMTEQTANEILGNLELYLQEMHETILNACIGSEMNAETGSKSIPEKLAIPEYRKAIQACAEHHDLDIENIGLPIRAVNQFRKQGYEKLSQVIFFSEQDLMQMRGLGLLTVSEAMNCLQQKIAALEKIMQADDSGLLVDIEHLKKQILSLYDEAGFSGLSISDFEEKLKYGNGLSRSTLKNTIGQLLAAGELEYVDFRCYRVYDHFSDYIESCTKVNERNREILRKRLSGKTLEEIAQSVGLTRERVRQIIGKAAKEVMHWSRRKSGKKYLDEDYYRYFYETYEFDRNDAAKWLGLSNETWNYFDMLGLKQGTSPLRLALEDTKNLDTGLRIRIRNYLNRNKIFVDDRWVEKRRSTLEEVVARKFCGSEVSFEQFSRIYNQFLEEEGIPYDPSIYYTDAVLATRKNRLRDVKFLLWTFHDSFRYYDIQSRDYSELWETLNLDSYENIEISTVKFMNEHPEIMKRYDIRNQYELHNLIRKTIPVGSYHQMVIGKMPDITFGHFDRNQAILDLLCENAPISINDFADLLNQEFGYDQFTSAAGYLHPFSCYLHKGIYDIDQKPMTTAEMDKLKEVLTEDFYYVDEIRKVYAGYFPEGDPEKVNAYNLKNMGFTVFSKYVLQNCTSAEAYFKHLLTQQDFTDITGYRKKFGRIATFSNILMEMKRELEIIEYEPNQIIVRKKLEASGMTQGDIQEFCDSVWNFTEGQTYFSIQSIQQEGFDSELFDYGFSDWFYSNLLLSDPRFSYGMMFGSMIFYRGKKEICIQSFMVDLLRKYRCVDMLDFMTELSNRYGCRKLERSDVTYRLAGSDAYYDDILDRLYSNVELYYEELEEEDL